jgi:predicted RNA-binding protein Jag
MDEMKEFVAESREAAVEAAVSHFGVSEGELDLRELDGSTAGLSGRVMVLARVRGGSGEPAADYSPRGDRDRDRDRDGDRDRDRDRGRDRGRDRDRDRDRGRGRGGSDARGRGSGRDGPRDGGRGRDRDRDRDRGRGRDRGRDRDRDRDRAPERAATERGPRPEPKELPHLSPTGNFVAGVIQRMGIDEGVEYSEEIGEGRIVISAQGDGVRELLRRDSRIGAALTHLAGRAAQKHTEPDVRVRVDLDGAEEEIELEPEEERLLAEVRELANGVVESGEPRETDPLSSRERWLVHNSLREVAGVKSESTGEGSEKRVKILPD